MAFQTVPVNDRISGPYVASLGQTSFGFDFPAYQTSEIVVTRERAGNEVQLALNFDYSLVVDINGAGGTVTLLNGALAGDRISILGQTSTGRETSFDPRGEFLATEVNRQLNRLHMLVQELLRDLSGVLRGRAGEVLTPLPPASQRASRALGFDVAGNPSIISPPDPLIATAPIPNIATLRLAVWALGRPTQVYLLTNYRAGDGGGVFYVDPTDTTSTDDGGVFIVDAAGNRWKRQVGRGPYRPEMWGAIGNGLEQSWMPGYPGPDHTAALQSMFNAAARDGVGWFVPAGVWNVSAPLQVNQPEPYSNWERNAPPFWGFDSKALLRASATMTHVIGFGDIDADYSQYLRGARISGGIIDADFKANDCVRCRSGEDSFITAMVVKNPIFRHFRVGEIGAPAPAAGWKFFKCETLRDPVGFSITAITNAAEGVVTIASTSQWANRRVAYIAGALGMTGVNGQFIEVEVVNSTQLRLVGFNTSALGTYTGGGTVYLTMPSMVFNNRVISATRANPCVVGFSRRHLLTTADTVHVADLFGMPELDGVCSITAVTSTTVTLNVNSSAFGVYSGTGGTVIREIPLNQQQVAFYDENASDLEVHDCFIKGVRTGVAARVAGNSFDGKYTNNHFWNTGEHGELLTPYDLGGDNCLVGNQIDPPFRWTARFRGPRNEVYGQKVNYVSAGGLPTEDLLACLYRIESGATVAVFGGGSKASVGQRLFRDVSGNQSGYRMIGSVTSNMWGPAPQKWGGLPEAAGTVVCGGSPTVSGINVSSVVRNSVGDYTVNFTDAISTTTCALATVSVIGGGGSYTIEDYQPSRTAFSRRFLMEFDAGAGAVPMRSDPQDFFFSIMRMN
jgi:hypothetical protein